jgi:hypothetical protein
MNLHEDLVHKLLQNDEHAEATYAAAIETENA